MFSLSAKTECHLLAANQKQNYNGIDLMKFFCAILVFMIHFPPFLKEGSLLAQHGNFWLRQCLCRVAVPFYFVSSGFFLFRKMPVYDLDPEVIKNYCFKILRLVGTWSVLLFVGKTMQLWYLGATVVAVILLSLCFYFRIRFRSICILACLLYAIGLLGDSYYGVIAPLENVPVLKYIMKSYSTFYDTTRTGVFMGFIFVLMGTAFSHFNIRLKMRTALIGLILSGCGLVAEVFWLKTNHIPVDYNMYIFLLPVSFFLFAFACAVPLKDRGIYKHLRNIGMLVYFTHLFVNFFTLLVIQNVETLFGLDITRFNFIMTFLGTLLLAVCIEWLSCKNRFKWLKWCIS